MKGYSPTKESFSRLVAYVHAGLGFSKVNESLSALTVFDDRNRNERRSHRTNIVRVVLRSIVVLFALSVFFTWRSDVLAENKTTRDNALSSTNFDHSKSRSMQTDLFENPDKQRASHVNKSLIPGAGKSEKPLVTNPFTPSSPPPPAVTYKDIPVGSYIIDMGVSPQTTNNGLKPYGMVYDLVTNQLVPVDWVISPIKAKDGIDFSSGAKSYSGGPFVIRAEYITPAVVTTINTWKTAGAVVDGPTTSVISNVPVAYTLTSMSRSVIDSSVAKNTAIVTAYYTAAGIPASSYTTKLPTALNSCDDLYSMPHADPTWVDHGNLVNFTTNSKGYLWAACHAVSVLENIDNPATTTVNPDMNFLSQTGLVNYLQHTVGTPPYSYQPFAASDPVMQFMDILDSATLAGSENIYMPKLGGAWRPTTTIAVWDPTQADVPSKSPGEAAVLAYGPAFGNSSNGKVMYEAGHNLSDPLGTATAQVAGKRAYFNFFLLAGKERGINVQASIPTLLTSGVATPASGTVTGGSGSFTTYQWTSSCGGTFSSSTSLNTTFTPPTVTTNTQCVIRLIVTDSCGRKSFSAVVVIVAPLPTVTLTEISNGGVGSFDFSGTNGFGTQTITTTTAGVGVVGAKKTLAASSTETVITETAPVGYRLAGVTCAGLGAGGTATPDLTAGTVTLDTAATAAGSNITCTFTNAKVADLTLGKSHSGNFAINGTGTYSFTVSNIGGSPTVGSVTVSDTLPSGLTVNGGVAGSVTAAGANGGDWTCNSDSLTPQTITCTSSTAISHTAGSNTSVFTLAVNVGPDTPIGANSITNTASVLGGGESDTANNSASDPTTVTFGVPSVGLTKSCILPADCTAAPQLPGTDLAYQIAFANTGSSGASNLAIVDPVPASTDFKIGSAATNAGTTGLVFAMEYSSDYDPLNPTFATWTYTPVSGGGGAPTGYDRNVKAIRWSASGTLSHTTPNNMGDVAFVTRIR